MKAYETETHIMRGGRLVPKPKPITLPLHDPIRKIRRPLMDANSTNPLEASIARLRAEEVAATREP